MTSTTTEQPPPKGQAAKRWRDRFVWHVASAFGVSVAQQLIGLARQIIIAAFFGLSREFDGYVVVYSLASMVVFNLTGVFDTIVVSRLVQTKEREGEEAFWRASNRVLLQALAASVVFAIGFMAVLWAALPIITAGFSSDERAYVAQLGWYFIPWIIAVLPYYALSAHLKAAWRFSWVFGAEILTILVSIVVIWLDHASVASLPLAYGAGYIAAGVLLLARRGFRSPGASAVTADFLPSMGKQYLSIQVGTASGFADRYFQSFVAPGGISALGYVGLIVNNLSSLLTFREIYVVPLTTALNREQRLERMLQGLTLISVPIAVFLVIYAEPVVGVLLQRGRFTPEAVAVTAMLLRIQALSLVISTMSTPLERLLQIVDRLFFVQLRYIAAFVGTLVFQPLFVFYLRMDVQGVAWAGICSGVAVLAVVVVLVRRCGIAIGWRGVMVNAVYASGMAAAAAALSWPLASAYAGLTELIVAGAIYGAVMGLGYLIVRRRWLAVIG